MRVVSSRRNIIMGGVAAAALMLAALSDGAAQAAEFCTYAGGRAGYENCGYHTWEQCMMALPGGRGGFCMRNPHDPALWGPPPPGDKRRRHAR
jgi:hypothetical protein